MKKLIIAMIVFLLTLAVTSPIYAAPNSVSYGTVGSGATALVSGSEVELYTPDGGAGSAYVRLNIPDGIVLNAITSLSYNAQITIAGAFVYAPEVVLNMDADGTNGMEGTGIGWMQSGHDPDALDGDNFLSGDSAPGAGTVDVSIVNRDALVGYNYWAANDARNGLSPTLYNPFATVLSTKLPIHDIDATDIVYSIDFVVGTSGSFDGMKALFSSVELNGTTYPVITVITKSDILMNSGVPGKGLENAPGLQKPFNLKSQAAENAGKK